MTEPAISEAAFAAADKLANDVQIGGGYRKALARHIQTTSDVAKLIQQHGYCDPPTSIDLREKLQSLILPDPKDPLEEAMAEAWDFMEFNPGQGEKLVQALAKRGLHITPIE